MTFGLIGPEKGIDAILGAVSPVAGGNLEVM
jgi:hypothetical protein